MHAWQRAYAFLFIRSLTMSLTSLTSQAPSTTTKRLRPSSVRTCSGAAAHAATSRTYVPVRSRHIHTRNGSATHTHMYSDTHAATR
jgi:hypothetical protein